MTNNPFEIAKKWLCENGGYVHPALERSSHDGLYGVFATEKIDKGEVIVQIPDQLCLDAKKFDQYPVLKKFKLDSLMDKTVAVFLVEYNKGRKSLYHPWFTILPSIEEFKEYHPYFASEQELIQMGKLCPRVEQTLRKFSAQIEKFYFQTLGLFKKGDIEWAYVNYLTRAFEDKGLVPFCDLFNHNSEKGRGIQDNYSLIAGENTKAGDEVHISYGKHYDTLELWLSFGFVDKREKHCVSCQNVKINMGGIEFDKETFIDESGASKKLLLNCQLVGGSRYTMSDVYCQLINSFKCEIAVDSHTASSPIVEMCNDVLKSRLELLNRSYSLV